MPPAWLLLLSAIGVEVAATSSLPRTDGFRNPGWTAAVIAGYAVSIWLLALVIRHIPVSVTYAIWSGVGTLTVVAVGATLLGQAVSAWQLAGIVLIIVGVVLINLGGQVH